jgi:hypothetical protein
LPDPYSLDSASRSGLETRLKIIKYLSVGGDIGQVFDLFRLLPNIGRCILQTQFQNIVDRPIGLIIFQCGYLRSSLYSLASWENIYLTYSLPLELLEEVSDLGLRSSVFRQGVVR